jgi:hypothetical protein
MYHSRLQSRFLYWYSQMHNWYEWDVGMGFVEVGIYVHKYPCRSATIHHPSFESFRVPVDLSSVLPREGYEGHTKYPTVLLLLISSSVVLGKCCLNLWTTVVWLRIQLRPKNRIRPVKMVDLLILCGFGLVSFGGEDMQCSRIRSEAVQVPE